MRPHLLSLLCFVLLAPAARAENPLDLRAGGEERSLDGTWQFEPAKGAFAPASGATNDVDAKARELAQIASQGAAWYDVQVPQFLNRIT